jgi:hypothetical protein
MSSYVLPENVVNDLQRFGEATQLCDTAGRALGVFVPIVDPSDYEAVEPEPTREELEEIKKSTEWYTTAEVLRHLENLR